jgi:predicted nucleic acid-binding Zn ribbon protein
MPTYEYECDEGHVFEGIQGIKDKPLIKCTVKICECKPGECDNGTDGPPITCNAPCKRLISSTSFVLKGSGWAKDGYGTGVTGKNKRTPKRPKGTG